MRDKLAVWVRALAVLAAVVLFALAWFDALPREIPASLRRTPAALVAVAMILAAGLNLLLSAIRSARQTR